MRFGPGAHLSGPKPHVKNKKKVLSRLWKYLRKHTLSLAGVFLLIGVSSLREMLTPLIISIAIDDFIIPGNAAGLLNLVLLAAALFVGVAGATWLQQYIMVGVTQKTLLNLRQDLFSHMQKLDLRYYDSHTHGELMSRFTNDMENINNVMSQVVIQFLSSILSIIGVSVMMFILNPLLALVTLVTVPLIVLLNRLIGKKISRYFSMQQKLLGKINGQIEETISGIRIVKLFRREKAAEAELSATNRELKKTSIKAQVTAGVAGPLMNMGNNIRYAIVAAAGGIFYSYGMASVGIIAGFLNYTRQFGRPISMMAQLYNSILSALAGAERVFEVLDEQPCITSKKDARILGRVRGDVIFKNVCFSYIEGTPVLKNISLSVQSGKTVALVGPTGAGKTTIINLLTRFYDIQEGTIMIDDWDIRDYSLESLRRSLGLVLQDTFLFSGTVMDNIRYGNLQAADEAVYNAAKASRADHFIRHLSDGYLTVLSEDGQNLSHGQRQLIAIARAILADPAILILDEATSNVDTRTELLIQEGMLQLMRGRTAFVIAHRLSTIRNADAILVMNNGEIIERGTHDELLRQKLFYARLHESHFETEIR
ncbi:MAG: ABC transporter ATP-binding protein [Spirochaetales bacterium]|nr:ABC transporter ATP-binding protein [Spirochaetales bacterium]